MTTYLNKEDPKNNEYGLDITDPFSARMIVQRRCQEHPVSREQQFAMMTGSDIALTVPSRTTAKKEKPVQPEYR